MTTTLSTTTLSLKPGADAPPPADAERQLVALQLGGETYGIDIAAIHTVLTPQPITAVPNVPAYIAGVMNLRGRILPVMDLRARFGLPPLAAGQKKPVRIIIVEAAGVAAGLIVDAVSEVLRLSASAIEPPSALLARADLCWLEGIGHVGGRDGAAERLLLLLDVGQVLTLSPDEAQALRALGAAA